MQRPQAELQPPIALKYYRFGEVVHIYSWGVPDGTILAVTILRDLTCWGMFII